MEEGFTLQCFGCRNVDCLIAEIARQTGCVKGMVMRMTKETNEIESVERERGRKEKCSDKKDEDRKVMGVRAGRLQGKHNRKNNIKHDMPEGDRVESYSREGG